MPATSSAYLVGVSCTPFGKSPGISFKDFTRDAYEAVIDDGGARLALAENGGGVIGFAEAVCAVTLLEGNR